MNLTNNKSSLLATLWILAFAFSMVLEATAGAGAAAAAKAGLKRQEDGSEYPEEVGSEGYQHGEGGHHDEGHHGEGFHGDNRGEAGAGLDLEAKEEFNWANGLKDMFSGFKERAQLSFGGGFDKSPQTVVGSPGPSAIVRESGIKNKEHEKPEQFGVGFKGLGDWAKLIFSPIELVKAIGAHFALPFEKFAEKIGKGLIFGAEAILNPLVVSVKIVEKIFVPDACRLKFICKMGCRLEILRESVLKFSPEFLEKSLHIKAFTDGIVGRECDRIFPNCEPRLKKPFEVLGHSGSGAEFKEGAGAGVGIIGREKSF